MRRATEAARDMFSRPQETDGVRLRSIERQISNGFYDRVEVRKEIADRVAGFLFGPEAAG